MLARDALVRTLAREAARAHERFAKGERLEVRYEPNVAFEVPAADAVAAAIETRLREVRESEHARKTSVAGPHRDDVGLSLDGVPLAAYGSQGQQRTAVLALKVAEYIVMRERSNEGAAAAARRRALRARRRRAAAFLAGIGDYEQAFVTATHLPGGLPPSARLLRVSGGRVSAAA